MSDGFVGARVTTPVDAQTKEGASNAKEGASDAKEGASNSKEGASNAQPRAWRLWGRALALAAEALAAEGEGPLAAEGEGPLAAEGGEAPACNCRDGLQQRVLPVRVFFLSVWPLATGLTCPYFFLYYSRA